MKKNTLYVLFLSINWFLLIPLGNLTLTSCSTDPVLEPELALKLEDVSCTEAWLQLTTNNIQLPATINLLKNNSVAQVCILNTQDSLLYIDSLLPNQSYKFKVVANTTNNPQPTTNEVLAQTMDTTNHNFTWQTFTFGEHSSSTLYDVAIIDENNIWAVGEIYMNDSLGNPDPTFYNLAKWNGVNWELKKIYYKYLNSINQYDSVIAHLKSIFAFSQNDIWLGIGNIIHWNGVILTSIDIPNEAFNSTINKIWGINSNDLYVVGNSGSIAHYQNGSWTKVESSVDTDLKDISGTSDGNEIWTCGWSNSTGRVSLLKINNGDVESLWDSQTNTTLNIYRGTLLNSLYANGSSEFVLVGGQVLRHSIFYKNQVKLEWVKTYNGSKVLELGNYAYRIKGSNKNNIVAAGDAAMIWHFNGATWYKHLELYNLDDRLYGLAVTENVTVAVGKRYSPGTLGGGLLIIGRR